MGIQDDLAAVAAGTDGDDQALARAVRSTGGQGSPEARAAGGEAGAQLLRLLEPAVGALIAAVPGASGPQGGAVDSEPQKQASRLTLLLRLLRNCCAESGAARQLLAHSACAHVCTLSTRITGNSVAGIVPRLAAAACGAELDVTAQLLANFAAGGGRGACAALWEALRPAALARLAAVRRHGTQAPLCHCLFLCCREEAERSRQLFLPAPSAAAEPPPLCALMDAYAGGDGGGEDLARLVGLLAYRQGLLGELLPALGGIALAGALRQGAGEEGEEAAELPCRATYGLQLLLYLADWPRTCATCLQSEAEAEVGEGTEGEGTRQRALAAPWAANAPCASSWRASGSRRRTSRREGTRRRCAAASPR
eukprot:jgi/Tetstr1/436639/TSEL_025435.t1